MSAVIRIAVDTLSNTTKSEKTNKLIDDPERNVHNGLLIAFSNDSLENAIKKPRRWLHGKVCVNGRPIL